MRGARLASFLGLALLPSRLPRQGAGHRRAVHRPLRTRRARRVLERDLGPIPDRRRQADRLERLQPPAWLRRRLPARRRHRARRHVQEPGGRHQARAVRRRRVVRPRQGRLHLVRVRLVFGGWCNSLSVICRQGEHDDGRKARRATPAWSRTARTTGRSPAAAARSIGRSTAARSCPGPIPSRWPERATSTWPSTTGRPTFTFDNLTIRPAP